MADEARHQAGNVVSDLRQRLLEQGQEQTERLAGTVRQWADDFAGLARNAPGDSPARSLAAQAADRGHRTADYLGKNGLEGLVGDLQGFARRRPGAFLGGAVLTGLLVGRVAKAGKAAHTADGARQEPESAWQGPDGARQEPESAWQEPDGAWREPGREESSPLPQGTVRRELPGDPEV
ncbi:hypothetical protein E6R18_27245 [Streptomyces sp. A1277]|uniref:hypothetical protein n=1 Tax=Streptomyces sp. A1277 TaxID=2563103 RepID=UPI0010A20752|nr:hypothetical protein [Streptomyces sp. A1277]THA28681.1 hypothetical protein E6R18_27245 [Streptomyces sp. A1277]